MDKVHLKLVVSIFLLLFLLLGGTAWYLVKKYYLSYNLLRLDPLEDRSLKKDILGTIDTVPNIWMIGDSRMARWNKDLLSPLEPNIVNLGIEGQTTSQVLIRLEKYLKTCSPEWLILEVGVNDLKIIGLNRDLNDKLVEDCLENISEIIDLCLEKGINIIVINIIPTGNIELPRRVIWNSSVDQSIKEANRKLKDYCKIKQVLFLDTYSILCSNNFRIQEQYQDGFLHLNDKAYEVLSNTIINEFGTKINSKLTINK